MHGISVFTPEEIKKWKPRTKAGRGTTFRPKRPDGKTSLLSRLIAAWAVFTGSCDVLVWPFHQ